MRAIVLEDVDNVESIENDIEAGRYGRLEYFMLRSTKVYHKVPTSFCGYAARKRLVCEFSGLIEIEGGRNSCGGCRVVPELSTIEPYRSEVDTNSMYEDHCA